MIVRQCKIDVLQGILLVSHNRSRCVIAVIMRAVELQHGLEDNHCNIAATFQLLKSISRCLIRQDATNLRILQHVLYSVIGKGCVYRYEYKTRPETAQHCSNGTDGPFTHKRDGITHCKASGCQLRRQLSTQAIQLCIAYCTLFVDQRNRRWTQRTLIVEIEQKGIHAEIQVTSQ